MIVEHVAVAASAAAVHNTFAPDVPDPELGELPNVCSHFVISSSGHIFRLVNLRTRCRHTVGLNWTAIGIEHTGFQRRHGDVLGDRRQMHASLRLTQYLRCRFRIRVRNVIGHSESLSSPFHRELVPGLRHQTHGDWRYRSMRVYRRRLRRLGACGGGLAAFPLLACVSGGGGIRTHEPPCDGQRFSRPPRSTTPAPLRDSVESADSRERGPLGSSPTPELG